MVSRQGREPALICLRQMQDRLFTISEEEEQE